ncbi:hypothetical protein EAH72_33870 [Pseudomonas caspiana]|nr:hypothetical protein [Pseudomonas caspiana]TPG87826.1 hypothetical protein EAH72_33870 [Pseudomonas caspiana]
MLLKLCRDGLLYALALYLFAGGYSDFDFDLAHWPVGLRWMLLATWLLVMYCLWEGHRERAKQARARENWPTPPKD